MAWIYWPSSNGVRARCPATGSAPRQITKICQRRGGVGLRGVSRMDAAAKPYLIGIWQRRCREPAWAAVQAWISTIAM